jgi:hypothetical protein
MPGHFAKLTLGLILVAGYLPLTAQTYTLQAISVPYAPNYPAHALGINNRGSVVGYFSSDINGDTPIRGFKRDANGVFESPINDPNSTSCLYCPFTIATGIDDSGVIVGYYTDSSGSRTVGFIRDKGVFTDFSAQADTNTFILGVNNKRDLVGVSQAVVRGPVQGFASIDGVVSPVDFPGAIVTFPYGIASDGTIVGEFLIKRRTFGFIRGPAGQYKAFQIPGAMMAVPYAVNNVAHKIAGFYVIPNQTTHGFVYDYITDTTMTVDWADPTTTFTAITGINSQGVIVGWTYIYDSQGHPLPEFGFIGTPQ